VTATPSFGSHQLCECLEQLGFKPLLQKATSHVKYKPPVGIDPVHGQRPFIMVQLGFKTYDQNACSRYISQIKSFGFNREEIIKHLK